MEVHGHTSKRYHHLGEGKLQALPPHASAIDCFQTQEIVLDWEGEVRCLEGITSGGFYTNFLVVKASRLLDIALPLY